MMHRLVRPMALVLVACGLLAGPAQAQVVISQAYGGAQNTGAVYRSDFVELHNNGTTAQSLAGWSLQYGSSTGTGFSSSMALSGSIPAGGYYLIQLASAASGTDLPTPDATGGLNLAGSAGKVALLRTTTLLSSCNLASPDLVDLVGYGSATTCFEGGAPAGAPAGPTAVIRAGAGCTDSQHNGNDFTVATPTPRNAASPAFACNGTSTPALTIRDTAAAEGDAGSTPFFFTVSLSQAAGAGGVTFDYATADGTATAGEDYVAASGSATIAEGETSVTLSVLVLGDTTAEPDETFYVNVSNVAGASVADGQALGTIRTDDVTVTPIHAIQGSGAASPLAGATLTTRGIVTGRKSSGFFLQAPDAEADADPATSEGVFVYTGGTPPAEAAVGNLVLVTATVAEYIPAADPNQLPLTELVSPSVLQLSAGHPLPAPVVLTTAFPAPDGGLDQLERLEGMRVTADSFTVVAPTKGSTSETSATGTSNGIFSVVVTGVARPFREPGIQVPDPDPSGSTATAIPRWDFNPEQLTVDSDAIGGAQLNLPAGTVLTGLVGPLDYGFRRYTLLADAATTVGVGPLPLPVAARLPTADEFTVAGYNLERFFDATNDPAIGEPVLTPTAFANRLNKASLAIRDYLHSPDIVAVVEVENLATLQALADKLNADSVTAGAPAPGYVAYLEEGNDVGGIDVGFLVRTTQAGGVERVRVLGTTQYNKTETWLDPSDNAQHLLNDRPPLRLSAEVLFTDGRSFPIDVLVVHQRSLNGVDGETASGATTEGDRVRRKRQAQADSLARLVQQLQDAGTHLLVLGDFNAFEFNDGYVDAMGTVSGTPSPDDATAVSGDGADLVDPDLINLASLLPAAQRYSFVFDGNAQSLDHVLVGERLAAVASGIGFDHARVNADFPETDRTNANSPARLSDHDPAIAYIQVGSADLSVAADASAGPVAVGTSVTFQVDVANLGPYAANYPGLGVSLDAELPGLVVQPAEGWSCDTPDLAGGTTTFACARAALDDAAGGRFTLVTPAPASAAGGRLSLVAVADAKTFDPVTANNSATAAVDVAASPADLWVRVDGTGRGAGTALYRVTLGNLGPGAAHAARVRIDSNLPAARVAVAEPIAGWSCTPLGGARLQLDCMADAGVDLASGAVLSFTVSVPEALNRTSYQLSAEATGADPDPAPRNNSARMRLALPRL